MTEYHGIMKQYLKAMNGAGGIEMGPYKSRAIFDMFQTSWIEQIHGITSQIQQVYSE